MGEHFGSIQVRGEDRDAIVSAVLTLAAESKKKFLVGPVLNGWIAIYPEDDSCALALSKRLKNVLIQLIVHDGDLFLCNFFQAGRLLSEYSSHPDYFGEVSAAQRERLKGKPEVFRLLTDSPEKLERISRLMAETTEPPQFDGESGRLEKLAAMLGIRNALTSYDYLVAGERYGISEWKHFLHIPDQTPEREAKKQAAAALRREKLKWRKEGLICNEWRPPGGKWDGRFSMADISSDPLNGGFLVLWRRLVGFGYPPQLLHLLLPWNSKPEPLDLVFSTTDPNSLTVSPSGNWLAFYDKGLRLWDRSERQMATDIQINSRPVAFSKDEKFLLCQCEAKKFTTVSLETGKALRTFKPETLTGDFMALHPSNAFIVTKPDEDRLGVVNLETSELSKIYLSRVVNLKFSPNGSLVFCATQNGLRVFLWTDLLASVGNTPKPLFTVNPVRQGMAPENMRDLYYICYSALDETQNRLLFCGREGAIRFLSLKEGRDGILADPPGKSPIYRLELSHDRKFIRCSCRPATGDTRKDTPYVQVWNYSALCRAAGLEWAPAA